MKGFASILLIVLLAGILTSTQIIQNQTYLSSQTEIRTISLHRTILENAVEKITEEELKKAIQENKKPEEIKQAINQKIIQFLETYSGETEKPIAIQNQTGELNQPNYLSLLFSEKNEPLTIQKMNENTHVLLLPINENLTYAEYTYTGGTNGKKIAWSRIKGKKSQTIFAIPTGYQVCSTNYQIVPCVQTGEKK